MKYTAVVLAMVILGVTAHPVMALQFPLRSSPATTATHTASSFEESITADENAVGSVGFTFQNGISTIPLTLVFSLSDDAGQLLHQSQRTLEKPVGPYEEIIFGFPIQPDSMGKTYGVQLHTPEGTLSAPKNIRLFADLPAPQAFGEISALWKHKWGEQRNFWLGYGSLLFLKTAAYVSAIRTHRKS